MSDDFDSFSTSLSTCFVYTIGREKIQELSNRRSFYLKWQKTKQIKGKQKIAFSSSTFRKRSRSVFFLSEEVFLYFEFLFMVYRCNNKCFQKTKVQ